MRKKFFDEEIYEKTGIKNLIVFAIYLIAEKKEECTFDKLVSQSFVLFPKKFSLPEISRWPDSRKLDRPLRLLRNKKLITRDSRGVISLTKAGRKTAEEIAKMFRQKKLKI